MTATLWNFTLLSFATTCFFLALHDHHLLALTLPGRLSMEQLSATIPPRSPQKTTMPSTTQQGVGSVQKRYMIRRETT